MGEWIYKELKNDPHGYRVCDKCTYIAQQNILHADPLSWKFCPMCGDPKQPIPRYSRKLGLTD